MADGAAGGDEWTGIELASSAQAVTAKAIPAIGMEGCCPFQSGYHDPTSPWYTELPEKGKVGPGPQDVGKHDVDGTPLDAPG